MAITFDKIPEKYRPIVTGAVRNAAAAGVPAAVVPLADIPALVAIWGQMTLAIAKAAGHELDRDSAWQFARSGLDSVTSISARSSVVRWLINLVPGGILASAGVGASMNAIFTLHYAKRLIRRFDDPNLDLGNSRLETAINAFKQGRGLLRVAALVAAFAVGIEG